jgi:diguanylate cyclase (GGDEF)-like protein
MSATAQTSTNSRASSRDQGRILLITEDPRVAAYQAALESAGFAVVGVDGGTRALIALGRTRPHLVVADTKIHGISADELARKLSAAQDSVPIILCGHERADVERRAHAFAAGAADYFQLPTEISLLLASAAQLVAQQQTIERLRAEADRDYLTGLANRRRFRKALGQEVERWRRYHVPCALLLLDIDFMKKINDTHGHSAGDVAIRSVASALRESSRDNDTAARLGGEEFALLLAGIEDVKAYAAAERLRQAIADEQIEGVGSITVSIGVAACPTHADAERTLYAASDAALYAAKREGRNRTVLAEIFRGAHVKRDGAARLDSTLRP